MRLLTISKMTYINGYVLISILLIMQVSVLFSLYALEASWIEGKISHDFLQQYEMTHQAEIVLTQIEGATQQQLPDCMLSVVKQSRWRSLPLSWWQNQSCTGNFQSFEYYYVIESLGVSPCAYINQSKGTVAEYYRLTLFEINKINHDKILLQSTLIKEGKASSSCDTGKHTVALGRQSLVKL